MAVTRREFIKTSALLGSSLVFKGCRKILEKKEYDYSILEPQNQIFTSCLQCNTGCGIKVKIIDGVAVKIDGNPYAPHCLYPHLKYSTPVNIASAIDAAICPKGQAGLQSVYDPYRVVSVLKRAGKRGENKWITIPFEKAIEEIVNGGYLFKHVKGEENRYVPGLKDIYALRDPEVSKKMAGDVEKLKDIAYKVNTGKLPKEELIDAINKFKESYRDYLHALINPAHPDLGPKNNQLVFAWGRLKAGRSDFISRFMEAFGSVNRHGHTTVCQGSLYFTGYAMSHQWLYDEKSKKVKWTKGEKFYWQADLANSKFIVFVGASPFEANYGPPGRTVRMTSNLERQKFVVVDPRFSKTAAKAWKWLPIKPGEEAALAMAFIRYIIENKKYDEKFLSAANKPQADLIKEPSWTNATWLVDVETGKFLRAGKVIKKAKDGNEYEYELFLALSGGVPKAVDPYEGEPVNGDLFVDTVIEGKKVKSVMQLIKEEAFRYSFEKWCEISGLKPEDVYEVVSEFVKYGKKAVCDIHRGVSQHTNGFYNALAWWTVNLLVGNFYHKGGMVSLSAWNIDGSKSKHQPFNFKEMHPGKLTPFGISIIRHGIKYEETTIFKGYPSKRMFYPVSSDIYQEIIPSMADAYPYPVKCLILYMGTPVYSLPCGDRLIPILSDVNKLPLFISIDITVGETSMYADYIIPDTSYLERWEFHGSHPGFVNKIQPVRNPAINPLTQSVKVFGNEMPICLESFLMAVAEKLKLSGFGKDGFGAGSDFTHYDDFYYKMVANIAAGEKEDQVLPDASDFEIQTFLAARKHLKKHVFDFERLKKAAGNYYKKVIYVLNRGGRFEDFELGYKDEFAAHPKNILINMYIEKVALARSSITGRHFKGYASYIPPGFDFDDRKILDDGLHLITHREISMTKSRTISNYYLLGIMPENVLLINPADASSYGIKDGDYVKVVSKENPGEWDLGNGKKKPLIIKVKVTPGIRPGVISFALGFGHFAYGSEDIIIDGALIKADRRRTSGAHLNPVMSASRFLSSTPLTDIVGGSVSFYDSKVKLIKV